MLDSSVERLLRKIIDAPSNHCFVCSKINPLGLQMRFEQHDGIVSSRFIPGTWHEGWQAVVHGGILAAILDEAMAYTLFFNGQQGVTAKMEVRYRAAVRPADILDVEAWVTRDTRRLVFTEARIRRSDEIVAEAVGTYLKQAMIHVSEASTDPGPAATERVG
jgi:acyl-coenzyme A thioesterase PaaI-like protein